MKRLVIAIDCDDVLIESTKLLVDLYNARYSTNVILARAHVPHNDEWEVDDVATLIGRFSELHASNEQLDVVPFKDAITTVHKLAETHELHLVTARHKSIEDVTIRMTDEHLKDCFTTIEHVGKDRSKGEVCKQLGVDILIDDSIRNLTSALEYGLLKGGAIHFGDYEWNQLDSLPDGVIQCDDWLSVAEEIEKIAKG